MIELKDLLGRFRSILSGATAKKEAVRAAIEEAAGVKINPEDIQIKNETVYLNIKPIYKNEIHLKKEKILLKLAERFGGKEPKKFL